MSKQPHGNGSSKFAVHQQDMGGWLRVFTDKSASLPDNLAFYLSHSLTEWFRQRPQLRLKTVAPINVNGDTVELHAWYEVHILPPIVAKPPSDGE